MKNKSYSVAVLGAGNIGSAVIERLENLDNEIAVSYTHLTLPTKA